MALTDMLQARETISGEPSVPPSMEMMSAIQGGPLGAPPQGGLSRVPQGGPLGAPLQGGPPQGGPLGAGNMPVFVPERGQKEEPSLNDHLKKIVPLITASISQDAINPGILEEAAASKKVEATEALQQLAAMENPAIERLSQSAINPQIAMEDGGLISLAADGEFSGRVPGTGHGMEDNVRMPIKEDGRDVATLAVSPSEYVVDSHTMAALGNGNADRGADIMDKTVKQIRQKAYGSDKQPREISGLAALKPLIERV
jgi:hypothetical protein